MAGYYIINYDLNANDKSYDDIEEDIKAYVKQDQEIADEVVKDNTNPYIKKLNPTTYIILANDSSEQIRDVLEKHIKFNDQTLFVGEINLSYASWATGKSTVHEWLANRT